VLLLAGVCAVRRPSTARNWSPDQAQLPRVTVEGPVITVENVRNFAYRSTSDYDVRYESRTYDLRKLDSLWFGLERFGQPGMAHTFLSFGFGEQYLAVSAEIRKEKGESFSPWRGLLDQYELMYVLADERDVIGLRTNHRKDPVWLYPVNAKPETIQRVFLDVAGRVNKLATDPEFYNTLTNTCTTNIVRHVNRIAPNKVPFSMRIVLPATSDRLARDLGLIGDGQRIDLLAQKEGVGEDFSRVIRSGLRRP
jgi:hypothetical protein